MPVIKNIELLTDLSKKEKEMMEEAGIAHKQFGGISFSIIEYNLDRIVIKIVQGKSRFENYHSKERLIEIVHETFGRFFTHKEIVVNAIAYSEKPVDKVNAKWVKEKMQETGIRISRIAHDSGISVETLEKVLNNKGIPLPDFYKVFLYYYFEAKLAAEYRIYKQGNF